MGRWLARLQPREKNAETLETKTLETFKTPADEVSRVLKVRHPGVCENFPATEWDERAAVLEYDEGLTRDEAEPLAAAQTNAPVGLLAGAATERSVVPQSVAAPRPCDGRTQALSAPVRPAGWLPSPGPGITILRPAVEVAADEYDRHLDTLIAALPAGSAEAQRLAFAKRKGWVVDRGAERIFTRGRT